jgi:hypothetical protein
MRTLTSFDGLLPKDGVMAAEFLLVKGHGGSKTVTIFF